MLFNDTPIFKAIENVMILEKIQRFKEYEFDLPILIPNNFGLTITYKGVYVNSNKKETQYFNNCGLTQKVFIGKRIWIA